jgi:hypothetical protein
MTKEDEGRSPSTEKIGETPLRFGVDLKTGVS